MAAATVPSVAPGVDGTVARAGRPRRALTTPGWFRLAATALALAILALGVIGIRAATSRGDAADSVALEATPLMLHAEDLYVLLADADAAASTAFLQAGLEPPELRSRYKADIETAGRKVAEIAAQSGLSDDARASAVTIAEQLPAYAGLIESARANNRLDFPLGAAYLRRASDLMRMTILPAATAVYEDAARQLYADYDVGTSSSAGVGIVVAIVVVVVLLLATQVLVARRTRRIINPGLLAATALTIALGAWAIVSLDAQQNALARSQREGSDQLLVLSTARILALRSLSDENLHLIERGTEPIHLADFDAMTEQIGAPDGRDGLLATAGELAQRTGTQDQIEAVVARYRDYLGVHARVRELDEAADYRAAVELAVTEQAGASKLLDESFQAEIAAARRHLDTHAASARSELKGLTVVVLLVAAATAGLALFGLQRRIREYR